MIEQAEFNAWLLDLRRKRTLLSFVNYVFVTVLAGFTLTICLLLSAAFTEEECVDWMANVATSVFVGAFLTDPAVGSAMLFVKLGGCWLLLRMVSCCGGRGETGDGRGDRGQG